MSESKMIVRVLATGSDVRAYTKDDGGIGYVARAFAKSGRVKEGKSWGVGFVSFGPRLELQDNEKVCGYNAKRPLYIPPAQLAEGRPCGTTPCTDCKYLRPNLLANGNVFEGEMRTNKAGVQYLALYTTSTEAPTHTLLRFTSNVEGENPESEFIESTTGILVSNARSTSDTRSSNEELILLLEGDEVLSNRNRYVFSNGKLKMLNAKKAAE